MPKKGWGTLIAESTTKEDFFAKVKESHPRDFILNMEKLEYAANKLFPTQAQQYIPQYAPEDFVITPEMQQWVDQRFEPGTNPNLTLT